MITWLFGDRWYARSAEARNEAMIGLLLRLADDSTEQKTAVDRQKKDIMSWNFELWILIPSFLKAESGQRNEAESGAS